MVPTDGAIRRFGEPFAVLDGHILEPAIAVLNQARHVDDAGVFPGPDRVVDRVHDE